MRTSAAFLLLVILVVALFAAPSPLSVSGWSPAGESDGPPRPRLQGWAVSSVNHSALDCPADEYEPNDGFAGAYPIPPGTQYTAYICPSGDEDWFKFFVQPGQEITANLTGLYGDLPADFDLDLYDPEAVLVAQSHESFTYSEHIEYTAQQQGEYRLRVSGYGGAYSGMDPYRLQVTLSAAPTVTPTPTAACPADAYEPNEDFSQAYGIVAGPEYLAYICPSGDTDWFQFAASAGQQITVDLYGDGGLPADYDLFLHHPSGSEAARSAAGGAATEQIVFTATETGSYRASVHGYAGAWSGANPYRLRVTLSAAATATPTPGPSCPTDPYEDNGTFDSAALIAAGESHTAYICPQGDVDFFKFWVISGQEITVLLDNPPAAYCLRLYDPDQVLRRSHVGDNIAPREVTYTADKTGYWYAEAFGAYNVTWSEDPYGLQVTLGEVPAATATATPTPTTAPPTPTTAPLATPTPTAVPSATSTPTAAPPATPTPTAVPSATPTPTAAPPATPTPTAVPSATPTPTAAPPATPTPTAAPPATPTPWFPGCPGDVHEPNDACGLDQPSWNLSLSAIPSYICTATDVDYWRIPAVQVSETMDILLTLPPGIVVRPRYGLQLYNPLCQSVKTSEAEYDGLVRMRATAPMSGTWFVKVYSVSGQSSPYPYDISASVHDCVRDRLEDNDNEDQSTSLQRPLTPRSEQALSICPAGEQDWFGVWLEFGDNLVASLTHDSSIAPLKMCLHDLVEGQVLQCTDPFLGLNRIDYVSSSQRQHYLVVEGAAQGSINHNYSISVQVQVPTPTPAPVLDLSVEELEVTQAIQDLQHSIPLVKGKLTRARVYVGAPAWLTRLSGLEVWLYGYADNPGGSALPGSPLKIDPGTYTLAGGTVAQKRLSLASSFNFEIPASWQTYASIALRAVVNPNRTISETNFGNNELIDSVFWKTCSTVNLKLVSVTSDGITVSLSSDLVTSGLSWMKDVYPIHQLNVSTLASGAITKTRDYAAPGARGYCSAQWSALVADMADIYDNWSNRPANAFVYGFLSASVPHGNTLGCGSVNGHGAAGILAADAGETLAHEVGHNLGRRHAPCGVPDPDPGWPSDTNPNGSIGEVGVRWSTSTVFGPSTPDFMSYCGPPWVSTVTYRALQTKLCTASASSAESAGSASLHLVASGWVSDGEIELRPLWVLDQPTGDYNYPGEGSYSLELQNASGAVLFVRRFDPAGGDQGLRHSSDYFHEIVPYAPQTQRVIFRQGEALLRTVQVSPHSPQVTLVSPNGGEVWGAAGSYTIVWQAQDDDGDPLVAHVLYSFDGGESWEPLAVNVHGNQYIVQGDRLPGSDQVLVQVRVSDGLSTTSDQSDAPFRVSRKAPLAFLLQPQDGATVPLGTPVVFSGLASDPEDGPLPVEFLIWTSDVDGALGTGADVAVDTLSTGTHHITLSATDSDGNVAEAAITLGVGSRVYLPVVLK